VIIPGIPFGPELVLVAIVLLPVVAFVAIVYGVYRLLT
jgi:hypothetical protein